MKYILGFTLKDTIFDIGHEVDVEVTANSIEEAVAQAYSEETRFRELGWEEVGFLGAYDENGVEYDEEGNIIKWQA